MDKGSDRVLCKSCKRLVTVLDERLKTAVTSTDKVKRQQPSSNCPLKFMSPTSKSKRRENRQRERDKSIAKYSHMEQTLDGELSKLIKAIDEQDVKAVLKEADDSHGHASSTIQQIWEMDKQRMKEEFSHDQKEICKYNACAFIY